MAPQQQSAMILYHTANCRQIDRERDEGLDERRRKRKPFARDVNCYDRDEFFHKV
jgi:hypothetical protein